MTAFRTEVLRLRCAVLRMTFCQRRQSRQVKATEDGEEGKAERNFGLPPVRFAHPDKRVVRATRGKAPPMGSSAAT